MTTKCVFEISLIEINKNRNSLYLQPAEKNICSYNDCEKSDNENESIENEDKAEVPAGISDNLRPLWGRGPTSTHSYATLTFAW